MGREGDKGRGEDGQERIIILEEKYGHFARVKRAMLSEGRRETRGGKGRRRCGGEEAYTPSRQPLKYA